MNYDREDYMRRQEAEHAMIRMRDPRYDVRNRLRAASAIEARRAETQGGSVHESAIPQGDA